MKQVGQAYVGEDGQWYYYTEADVMKGNEMKKEAARDSMGFLINPKNFTYRGYRILAVDFDDKTVYDVYLGHVFRDTFNTVEAAKQYIDQPRF